MSLGITDLTRFFGSAIFSARQVARGKPAPDLFLFVAERMDCRPSDCIVVEDAPAGIAAACAAGMTAVGFTGGGHATPDLPAKLRAAGARQVVGSMAELAAVLDRMAVSGSH